MTSPPDFQALARLYAELWQAQLGSLIGDPALARTLGESFAAAAAAAMGAPPPARPGASGEDLAAIRRRLEAIEARLSALEAPRRGRRKTAAKSGSPGTGA